MKLIDLQNIVNDLSEENSLLMDVVILHLDLSKSTWEGAPTYVTKERDMIASDIRVVDGKLVIG